MVRLLLGSLAVYRSPVGSKALMSQSESVILRPIRSSQLSVTRTEVAYPELRAEETTSNIFQTSESVFPICPCGN